MMSFKHSFLLLILLATFATAGAQENQTDAAGLKQGIWLKKYSNGNPLYEGVFKDNKPVGVFKRYYEDGKLQSVLTYDQSGKNANAVFYHPNGKKAAEGVYSAQKKEGLWKYYSPVTDEYLVSEDNYSADQRNGLSRKFYPSGAVAETLSFIKGTKDGEWIQYYDDGKLCLKGFYVNGRLDGAFIFCFPGGSTQLEGQYLSDIRAGKWKAYNQDGSLKYEIEYINGKPSDPSLTEKETQLLDELEKNKGKILDPEMTGNEQQ
jgi:antitoxin component YwqK of YwqJK toxin-antitoxin module